MQISNNILHIIPYGLRGGAETFTVDLIKSHLDNKEVGNVYLITYQMSKSDPVCDIKINSENFFHYNIKFTNRYIFHLSVLFNVFLFLVKRRKNIQIVNTHLLASFHIAFIYRFFKNINFFHTVHNQAIKELGANLYSFHHKVRAFYYRNINVISISESVKKSVDDLYNIKSKLIPNGAVFEKNLKTNINTKTKAFNLLAVGNTRKEKNFQFLIDAFNNLKKNYDIKLTILGALVEGFEFVDVKEYEKNSIFLKGSVNNVQDYMKNSSFLCMPSIHEGMPITLLEAKANRLIPVVTPAPGIVELVSNNEDGFMANDMTQRSYELALKEALECDESTLSMMKKKAVEDYNNLYSMTICERNYFEYYKNPVE